MMCNIIFAVVALSAAGIFSIVNAVSIQSYQADSTGQYLVYSYQNIIYMSQNYGSCWTTITAPIAADGNVGISDSGTDLYFYTELPDLYFSSTSGKNWSQAFIPGSNTGTGNCAFDRSFQYGYCYEAYEYLYLSSTYGSTWTDSSAPYGLYYYGLDGASDSGQYVTLPAFNTGVFVSQNYGSTWRLITLQQSSICSTAVSGNGQYMFATAGAEAAGYAGRIYYSSDYGTIWKLLPNSISANYQSVYTSKTGQFIAATFYVSTEYYLSTDYGNSWTTVTAAYNQVVFSTSRWYILSNNVLYYTMNNGTTWVSTNIVTCPTESPSVAPTYAPSFTPLSSPSSTPTYGPSVCPSCASVYTPSNVPTNTPTSIPNDSPSSAPTFRPSDFPSSCTPSYYPTCTPISSPTRSPSCSSPSFEPSGSPSLAPTCTCRPSSCPSCAPTSNPSYYSTCTPTSSTPTESNSLNPTYSPSSTSSGAPSLTNTNSLSDSPSVAPTYSPTHHPTYTPISTSPTGYPSSAPTTKPSSCLSCAPTSTPSYYSTCTPTSCSTESPSCAPTYTPSYYMTGAPVSSPTCSPSFTLSDASSWAPTNRPSNCSPACSPSHRPPTSTPTESFSSTPTYSGYPSLAPTCTCRPSSCPSCAPTSNPSYYSTCTPTSSTPTESNSLNPTYSPSSTSSGAPSLTNTNSLSDSPSVAPTYSLSYCPTYTPISTSPTGYPSSAPTTKPSSCLSCAPTSTPSYYSTCIPTSCSTGSPSWALTYSPSDTPSYSYCLTSTPTSTPTTSASSISLAPTWTPSYCSTSTSMPSPPIEIYSSAPTYSPSFTLSGATSLAPTCGSSGSPTYTPTYSPSSTLSGSPSSALPTRRPSGRPSSAPSLSYCSTSNPLLSPSVRPFTTTPSCSPIVVPTCIVSNYPTVALGTEIPTARPSPYPNCEFGTYFVQFSSSYICVPCSPGHYSMIANASTCSACPLNTYSDSTGATICTSCPPGYVTGTVASLSEDDCVNPVVNFSFGILSLLLSFLAVFVYIILGRVQRIAFERRRWLIEKSASLYGIFLKMVEEVRSICRVKKLVRRTTTTTSNTERNTVAERILFSASWWISIIDNCSAAAAPAMKKAFKLVVFALVVVIAAVGTVFGVLILATLQVLFNGMLLHRAYRGFGLSISSDNSSGSSSFFDRVSLFLVGIGQLLHVNSAVGTIVYPVNYVLNVLSFDLSSIQVPCPGSQAPINLLLDCFIAAFVLISINSDAHLLWIARIKKSFRKWMLLLLSNRSYLSSSVCSSITSFFSTVAPFVVYILPSPMKINQYVISYVSISEFFVSNGRSRSSSNCDAAAAIPVDTIEAYLTTILVVILLPPIVYLFSQVLFPSPMMAITKSLPDSSPTGVVVHNTVTFFGTTLDKWWRLLTAWTSLDWFFMKSLFNLGFVLLRRLQDFIVVIAREYGQEQPMQKFKHIFEDPLHGAALPEVAWLHVWAYFEPQVDIEWQTEEMKWQSAKEQFPTYYSMVQLVLEDALNTASMRVQSSSRFEVVVVYVWGLFFKFIGCWIVPLQLLYSVKARMLWSHVTKNYVMYFFMSAGCWTDHAVQQLSLIEKFRDFDRSVLSLQDDPDVVRTMENPLFARSSILVDSAATIAIGKINMIPPGLEEVGHEEDVFSMDSNVQEMFVNYLSAITSCRSVIWQVIPGMTAFAILSVDTSMCPVLVFSERMRLYLPPLVAHDVWADAIQELRLTFIYDPKNWQIFLVASFLWMKNSRLVQFTLQIFVNIISFYIVFSSDDIYIPVCAFVGVELLVALLTFGNYFVQLHRIFF